MLYWLNGMKSCRSLSIASSANNCLVLIIVFNNNLKTFLGFHGRCTEPNHERDPSRFYCENCDRSYRQRCHLLCHQRYQCGGKAPQFQCDFCPKRCHLKSNLRTHMKTQHPQEENLVNIQHPLSNLNFAEDQLQILQHPLK